MHKDKVLGVQIMSKAVRVEGGSQSSESAGLQELGARRWEGRSILQGLRGL